MDGGGDDDHADWNTEDELEIDNFTLSSCGSTVSLRESYVGSLEVTSSGSKILDQFVGMGFPVERVARAVEQHGEEETDLILQSLLQDSATASASSSKSKVVDHFIGMGFPEELVVRAIQENGEEDTDIILETLLTYSVLETPTAQQPIDSDNFLSEEDESLSEGFSDVDCFSEIEDGFNPDSDNESKLLCLRKMGYAEAEASIAIERCGPGSTISVLTDFICAAQMAKEADALLPPEEKPKRKKLCDVYPKHKKRRNMDCDQKRLLNGDDVLHLPNPMVGFGVPSDSDTITHRTIPEAAKGPPFFYYENVALAPKGVWQTISRFLYDVEPEFVDSKYFCAAARKRGYVHNLPVQDRFPLLPIPPLTIQDAFPITRKWWPSWDTRTKLNCLQTCIGSAKLTERIRQKLERCNNDLRPEVLKFVMYQCRKWNLVWVGRNKAAVLEPDEVEMLLGFPRNHTRGGGISRTDRYKSLGNSFQIDTVACHLSVLKKLYPRGINVLSLFSGIGGAEVALHRLGIPMNNVVSVEISEVNRNIIRSWWEQTNQQGNLIEIEDVQQLNVDRLEKLMTSFGGFDLVIGGSPCNNLTGANRHHRDGLEGKESALFFDYCRILDLVKNLTPRNL